jgi:glycosyltransferase involved in cell wall biosynthesis
VRVLFVIGSLRVGGSERQVLALAEAFTARGVTCRILCLTERGPLAGSAEAAGIAVDVLRPGTARALRRFRPDVVYCLGFVAYALAIPAAAVLVPSALRVSGRRSQAPGDVYRSHRTISRLIRRFTNRLTQLAIANSDSVAASHIADDPWLAPRMRVIPNGVAFPEEPARPDLAPPRILCIANLRPIKAHGVLLDAVARLPAGLPWTLELAGDGPLRGELEQRVAALPEPDRVRFLGQRDDVAALLQGAAVVVLTSTAEGNPNAVLEALASGVPVVATDVGPVAGLLQDGAGTVVAVGDSEAVAAALQPYLEDPSARRAAGTIGRERVRDLAIGRAAAAHLELFSEELSRRGRAEMKPPER